MKILNLAKECQCQCLNHALNKITTTTKTHHTVDFLEKSYILHLLIHMSQFTKDQVANSTPLCKPI